MKLGFIGLGRMGKAMVLHLLENGVDVVVYNRTQQKIEELSAEIQNAKINPFDKLRVDTELSRSIKMQNDKSKFKIQENSQLITHNSQPPGKLIPSYSIQELVDRLEKPRTIWIMVEHGKPVDDVIDQLISDGVEKEDIIIDGGNSFYKDSIRRFEELEKKGIHFLDVGVSGGLEGARNGACVMVGGEKEIYKKVKPVLEKLALKDGLAYFGPAGAGHFVKMVHNGVEYGMLEAIGEGFEILNNSHYHFDMYEIAKNWSHGSVVRGWLMELLEHALKRKSKVNPPAGGQKSKVSMENYNWLEEFDGKVGGGSTGDWTTKTAEELGVDAPVIRGSYEARLKSQQKPTFAGKVISALRYQFGGHKD